MGISKSAVVNFLTINSTDTGYFTNLENTFMSLEDKLTPNDMGGHGSIEGADENRPRYFETFETNTAEFLWQYQGIVDTIDDSERFYYFSLIKQGLNDVIKFEDGQMSELEIFDNVFIGKPTFFLVSPKRRIAAVLGGGGTGVSNFLKQFAMSEKINLTPLLDNEADQKCINWDYYSGLKLSFQFGNIDNVTDAMATPYGKYFQLINELQGLKFDVAIKTNANQTLEQTQIRNMIEDLILNDFCDKLVVKGANYSNSKSEEIDLKKASIKFRTMIETSENFITPAVAKEALIKGVIAYSETITKLPY